MALNMIRGSLATAKLSPMTRLSHHASKFQHALSANTSDLTQLDSGLTVATERIQSSSATVGVYVDGGARHETKELNGITNFIQRLLIKGTKNRDGKKLRNDLYSIGAQYGSFTTRENCGFYLTLAPNDVSKAMDILTEMIASPALNDESIDATRREILAELDAAENDPQQVAMDYLHAVAYQDTSLAFSKYGPSSNVERFTKADIEKGLDLLFKPARLVVAASGDVDHQKIVDSASKGLSSLNNSYMISGIPSFPVSRYTGSDIRVRDDAMSACHVAFAIEGPGYESPDHVAFDIAAALAGKWDLTMGGGVNTSSYIGMVSAAEHLAQSFEGFNILYRETALFGGYFVGERMSLEDILWQLQYQWKSLCTEITNNELAEGKNIFMSKLIRQREGSTNNTLSLATEVLRYGQRSTLEDWKHKLDRVNNKKMHEIAEKYIWDRCPVVSAVGPCENLPLYEEIRMKMSWMRY